MSSPSGRAARGAALLGDDFQHLHAWSEALDAARPLSDVSSFSVEAIDAGSYDDIVVRHISQPHLYIQAKFTVDATDGFSLDWLLAPTGSGTERPSLAQRALATFRQLQQPGRPPQLRLVTNRELRPADAWLSAYRDPETHTLGHAVGRLLDGEQHQATAFEAVDRLRAHLDCSSEELVALLSAWELRWSADLPTEKRLARARMVALGLTDTAQALLTGREMIREYVRAGLRQRLLVDLLADIERLKLRARPAARVLSVAGVGDEPHAADADVVLDLREVFGGRAGDAARGLPAESWATAVAPLLTGAVTQLETSGAGPVLVRATVRLPTWFFLGTRMRHVRNWTLLTELGAYVWSSTDVRTPGAHLHCEPSLEATGSRDLVVALSVTADVRADVKHSQQRGQLPAGDVLWLTVPAPGSTSVVDPGAGAAIVDDARTAITDQLRAGALRAGGPYQRVHLVMSAPRFVALFLGHRWHRLTEVVVYEDLGAGLGYQPAYTVAD